MSWKNESFKAATNNAYPSSKRAKETLALLAKLRSAKLQGTAVTLTADEAARLLERMENLAQRVGVPT